jgi:hypothetical protein
METKEAALRRGCRVESLERGEKVLRSLMVSVVFHHGSDQHVQEV